MTRYIDADALSAVLASEVPALVSAAQAANLALSNAVASAIANAPTVVPVVTPPVVVPPTAPGTRLGTKTSVFWDDFANGALDINNWTNGKTSSFPNNGPTNVGDTKLDYLDPAHVTVTGTTVNFTASPSGTLSNGKTAWHTGLLTTEYSPRAFQAKTGDYVEIACLLPSAKGAWPALWTWRNGDNEIDSFEYHPDNANLLELSNHVAGKGSSFYYTNTSTVKPGVPVTIGTYYGATSVDWYVNGTKVHSDNVGVGTAWTAYLIVNLSVEDGTYHSAPVGSTPFTFTVDSVGVWR